MIDLSNWGCLSENTEKENEEWNGESVWMADMHNRGRAFEQ